MHKQPSITDNKLVVGRRQDTKAANELTDFSIKFLLACDPLSYWI